MNVLVTGLYGGMKKKNNSSQITTPTELKLDWVLSVMGYRLTALKDQWADHL